MLPSNCADRKKPRSIFRFAILFLVTTIASFVTGRIHSRSLTSAEAFNTIGSASTPSVRDPTAQTIGPKPNRDTHFIEIERGGNLLGVSSLSPNHQSPSLVLESRQPRTTKAEVDAKSGSEGRAQTSNIVTVEHLVHSALLAHSNPVRVAILGDANGILATEVLKHSTVSDVEVFLLSGTGAVTSVDDVQRHDDDPRLVRIHTDPEELPAAILLRSESAGVYDVILWNRSMYVKDGGEIARWF
jgi:hypothetical protein